MQYARILDRRDRVRFFKVMGACQFSAWQLTSQLQLNNGRREGDSTWQVINAATVQAEALKEQDVAYLG